LKKKLKKLESNNGMQSAMEKAMAEAMKKKVTDLEQKLKD